VIWQQICCLLGSANACITEAGLPQLHNQYISQLEQHPACAKHPFAYGRHIETSCTNDWGLSGSGISRTDCMNRGVNLLELTIAQCAPKPVILQKFQSCESGGGLGSCPPCDTDPDTFVFPDSLNQEDCLPITIDDEGQLVWAEQASAVTESNFNIMLLLQRESLLGLAEKFCECYTECYGANKKVRANVLQIRDYCEAGFIGSKVQIVAYSD